ncbi:MarR family transcriptional regulator [Candidatus Gottesmanbacteria bacterium]|nr:MarR family transcriptional regulator [Candidatus Gottesmanbacteria bacterium]
MKKITDSLGIYKEILQDQNCLRIIYYLYKYNPDVPVKEISEQLDMSPDIVSSCIDKLLAAEIIYKRSPEATSYTLTPMGRSAFRNLIEE